MKEIIIIVIILGWLICSVLSHGFYFAWCQGEWPIFAKRNYWTNMKISLFLSLFGPITLFTLFMVSATKHDLKFW